MMEEIIAIGKKLAELRLVAAHAGNLSLRLDEKNILITATGTSLGDLQESEILQIDLTDPRAAKNSRLTSEFPLHQLIHENFPDKAVIHCHPPLANAYFALYPHLKTLTFETKLYLGDIPVVEQETPSITKPQAVIDALKNSNLVVLKNHGVVAVGKNFSEALNLIEMLEDAVKVVAVARLLKKDILDDLDQKLKDELVQQGKTYPMFSQEHIQAIVDLVNQDEFIRQKGQEMDLTVELAIKLNDTSQAYRFKFIKGEIVKLEQTDQAPFLISAPREIWEQVFLGKLDSFVAVTQGKMKLEGQLAQLSRWYVPFVRLFELFRQVRFS